MARTLPNVNRQFVMATRPFGLPKESDFAIREVPLPVPAEGEMLIRAYYLSADPLQRYRMEATSSYGKVLEGWRRHCGAPRGQDRGVASLGF